MYTYKVECFYDVKPFYTDDKKQAQDVFNQFKLEYGDGIRLYEGIKPDNQNEEIKWQTIDLYDEKECVLPFENKED